MTGNKKSYSDLILSISVSFIHNSYFLQKIRPSATHRAPCPREYGLLCVPFPLILQREWFLWEPTGKQQQSQILAFEGSSRHTVAPHGATHHCRWHHGQVLVPRGGNTPGSSSVCCTKGPRADSRRAPTAPQPAFLPSQARREAFHFPPSATHKETWSQA